MFDLRPYRTRGAQLSDYLTWAGFVAPGVIVNKDGSFQRTLQFRGPDLDSSTPGEAMAAAARLNNALRRFGSGWCLHVEARREPAAGYPDSTWPDAVSWLIDAERRAAFEAAGARFETTTFLTLTWLPPEQGKARLEDLLFERETSSSAHHEPAARSAERSGLDDAEGLTRDAADSVSEGAPDGGYRRHLERFLHETDQCLALIEAAAPEARWLDDAQTMGFLHGCISERQHAITLPPPPFFLDAFLADTPLVGGVAPRLGRLHLRMLSVRAFVTETEPGLFDALNRLPLRYRWSTRFLPLDREEARRQLGVVRKRWFAKRKGMLTLLREALFREESALLDNDAANQATDADAALQTLGLDAVAAGFVTIVIVVAEPDPCEADEAVRAIQQTTDSLGFVTQVESVNAVEAWLGTLPGQAYADLRRPILLTPNLAHLLPFNAVWAGSPMNAHLDGPPLMVTATDGATPFRLDLHVGDVGHTLVVGPTGAGKSVLLALLAAQWRRHPQAQVYMFDKGRSVRALVLGMGGGFFDLGEADAPGLQPLRGVDAPETCAWALDWLTGVLVAANVAVNPERRAELWRALDMLAGRPARERTMSLFCALVQDRDVREGLAPFTHAGPYGRLLDNDGSGLGYAPVQAFEMETLMRRPHAAGAVLGALFHELEQRFDGRPTLMILDEAWLFLRDARFAARIEEWLKTLRKQNVAVVFASQELADIARSDIAPSIINACQTRIYLPNANACDPQVRTLYEGFGFNDRQVELIACAAPRRDYYYASAAGRRLFDLTLGPAALAFAGASRPEDQALIDRVLATHGREGFAQGFLEARGLPDAASAIGRFEAARTRSLRASRSTRALPGSSSSPAHPEGVQS